MAKKFYNNKTEGVHMNAVRNTITVSACIIIVSIAVDVVSSTARSIQDTWRPSK